MQEALSDDYILTARAKGLTERAILFKHAFKNASLPLITNAALSFAFILSGRDHYGDHLQLERTGKWLFDSIGYSSGTLMREDQLSRTVLCVRMIGIVMLQDNLSS